MSKCGAQWLRCSVQPDTLPRVEHVVAVEVALTDGGKRYFLTWGRIQDAVDPAPLCEVVLRFCVVLPRRPTSDCASVSHHP